MNISTKPSAYAGVYRVSPIKPYPSQPIDTFNIFRSKLVCMWCAVPEHLPVPRFIDGDAWVYDRKLEGEATLPIGFTKRSAEIAIRFNGYYLFQMFERSKVQREL